MNIELLEKRMNVAKKYDMMGTPINVNDIICVAEGSTGGSAWLNRGIVIDIINKGITYIDLENENIRHVIKSNSKSLIITEKYTARELKQYKDLAANVMIKLNEKQELKKKEKRK